MENNAEVVIVDVEEHVHGALVGVHVHACVVAGVMVHDGMVEWW